MKRRQAPAKTDEGVDLQGSKKPKKPEQKLDSKIVYVMLPHDEYSFIQQTI